MRPKELKILYNSHNRVVKADCNAHTHTSENVAGEAVCVMNRKNRERNRALTLAHIHTGCIVCKAFVTEHNTLAFACCAGSKEDRAHFFRVNIRVEFTLVAYAVIDCGTQVRVAAFLSLLLQTRLTLNVVYIGLEDSITSFKYALSRLRALELASYLRSFSSCSM